ncbi:MAG: hypothetical protein ABJA74_15930 [Lapillicoccus sp.]
MTQRLRHAAGPLGVAVCVAALASSCASNDGSSTGSHALYAVGSTHELCVGSDRGQTFVEGLDTIANRGPGPVRIDRAVWLDSQGFKLLGIGVFQRQEGDQFATFGVWRGIPPQGLASGIGGATLVAAWARRVPAEGATLPVSDGNQHYFDIVVSWSGLSGTAGPVRLSYTDAEGHKGTVDTRVTVTVHPTCH